MLNIDNSLFKNILWQIWIIACWNITAVKKGKKVMFRENIFHATVILNFNDGATHKIMFSKILKPRLKLSISFRINSENL